MQPPRLAALILCSFAAGCAGDAGPDRGPGEGPGEGEGEAEAEGQGQGQGQGDGGGEGEAESEGGDRGPPPRNPLGETVTLAIEPFDVQPGSERQVCKLVNVPGEPDGEPLRVVRLRSVMSGRSHHFNLYKVHDDARPVAGEEGRVRDCSPAAEQLAGEAAYIFGSATRERVVDTPAGVAFALAPGQRLILEQHVINYTGEAMQGDVTLELVAAGADADIQHHADIAWFGNWHFYLPPGRETSSTDRCTVPFDLAVIGLMSHTHELGTQFSIEHWRPDGTTHLYDSDDWAEPPYLELHPPLRVAAGEGLEWTCTWFNDRDRAVGPGAESIDEMCIAFAAYYPTGSLDAPAQIQCNEVL